MTTRPSRTKLQLPHLLIEAVKDERAVLVMGAGASMECKNTSGDSPPGANKLRDHLAQKSLGTKDEKRDLATIAEMAITGGVGEPLVFEEIAKQLSGFTPSNAHIAVGGFRWRGLATTNYNTFIEDG